MSRLLKGCLTGGSIGSTVVEGAQSVLKGCSNVLAGCLKVKVFEGHVNAFTWSQKMLKGFSKVFKVCFEVVTGVQRVSMC